MHICSHEDGAAMPVGGGALIEAGDANQRRGTLSHNAMTAADGVDCEHKGLLPLWFKPWVFCRYGLSPFVFTIKRESAILLGFTRVPKALPSKPPSKLDPLATEPTSLHWRLGGLWVGRETETGIRAAVFTAAR